MNPKRLAGYINLIAAAGFSIIGFSSHPINRFYVTIAVIFLFIGIIRLRRTPPGPLPPS